MSLLDIWNSLDSAVQGMIIALGVVLLGTVKIKPLEINIWQWLAKTVGNALNKDLISKVDSIETRQKTMEVKFDKHIAEDEKQDALTARKCILRFAREILQGQAHTKEDFLQVLEDVDFYEKYCLEHPDFPNKRAVFASKLIQDNYQERLEKADFLAEEYRCQLVEKSSKEN